MASKDSADEGLDLKIIQNRKRNEIKPETNGYTKGTSKNGDDESSEKNEKSKKDDVPSVPYWKLFRYASGFDFLLIVVGTIAGMIHGAGLPALFIVFGELTTDFTTYGRYQQCNLDWATCLAANLTDLTEEAWNEQVLPDLLAFRGNAVQFVLYFVYIAVAVVVLASLQTGCWSMQAARQIKKLRSEYFYAIMRQDIGYHDVTSSGELSVRLSSDVDKVKDGIAEKVSTTIQYASMCLSGLIVGLVYSWKLGLVTLSVAPLIGLASGLFLTVSAIFTKKELAAYAKAGSIAEEAISSIRTVVAFGCQHKEVDRYTSHLGEAKKVGIRRGFVSGFSIGFLYLTIFGMYGLAFWYGTTLVIAGEITIGNLTTCFFGILIAAFSLGTAGSSAGAFSEAKAAGAKIFEVIDRNPPIDIFSDGGKPPHDSSGEVIFRDVEFVYPSRPDVEVLKGVNLKIEHGKTTALVGQSGCGKSTIIQLIQRFYDANKGSVLVAGEEVTSLNVRKHRDRIGVVAQEPVLFAKTIRENIRWGRDDVTDKEIEEAAKQANAYDFIMKFPQQFETFVGEGGGQMSGGQKQRIAIARAIARNPKILLLDEATSALDTESESIVQAALEKASAGRTTVVIAHRLSTIRNADKIIAFQDGRVMEEGSHDELLKIEDGVYSNLINMQAGRENDEEDELQDEDQMSDVDLSPDHEVAIASKHKLVRERTLSNGSGPKMNGNSSFRRSMKKPMGKLDEKEEEEEEEEEDLPDVGFMRIMEMNKPEWAYMAVGSIFAAVAGSLDPVNAILFAEVLNIFTLSNTDEQLSRATLYGLLFLALGAIGLLSYILEGTLFAKSGVELTLRLRKKAFHSMLRQEIGYFDDHKNSTGALCTRLATDASRVQGSTGVRLGLIIKNFCSLGVALGISFAFGWQLTLLTMAFIPFLVLGGFLEVRLLTGQEEGEKNAYEEAGHVAIEAIKNIRTVASLTKERVMYDTYLEKLEAPFKKATKRSIIIGLGYGYSQCVIYFAYAAVFRLGVELVITEEMTFDNVFKVLTAVIFGAMAIGQNSSFAPDYAEAVLSAKRMFALFDREPAIDAYSDEGVSPDNCKGEIKLESVFFRYPTRPDLPILRGCSIVVRPGQTLALVGQSGCGKSTSVQLIERFYDPEKGTVTLDGVDISKLNIGWLRQQMGLVSQEPVLFDQSIADNIRYGDCKREVSQAEVEAAAQNANIHNFIADLPEGYSTSVGAKGGQLSGGQKQRVAIARALLRNPKILLLDEATSALDTESERIVQSALDAAREGRTSIIIAHRLSTVKNADQIAVIDNGVVAEVGTHDELLASKGAYFSLVNAQLSEKDKE